VRIRYLFQFIMVFACFAEARFSHADEAAPCELNALKALFPAVDPFDETVRMPIGKWKNQIVDTSTKRPARILSQDAKKIVFANFRDGEAFHQAKVNLNEIEDVYFRINRFSSGVPGITPAHTLFYFKMKPGSEIILGAEKNSDNFAVPTRVSEFVMSMDYLAPKDIKYDVLKSAKPNYLSVIDFRSARDYGLRGEDKKYAVEYLKLNLSDEEKAKLLHAGIQQSQSDGVTEPYFLASRNCTTVAFDLLDGVVDYPLPVEPFRLRVKELKDPTAGPSERALQMRGLVRANPNGRIPKIWAAKDGFLPKPRTPAISRGAVGEQN
jgi:hypothetical protein